MKTFRRILFGTLLTFSMGASCPLCPPEPEPPQPPVISVDNPLDPDNGCVEWRYIGIKEDPAATCPGVDGWSARPLFSQRDQPNDILPPELQQFCVYESGTVNAPDPRERLLGQGIIVQVDKDCMAVGSAAPALETLEWPTLEKLFLLQAGSFSLPAPRVPTNTTVLITPRATRLALLDTSATTTSHPELATANSPHGFTLANMAARLLCRSRSEACVAHITSQLTMPYITYNKHDRALAAKDLVNGGYIGLVGDVATSVMSETAAWRRAVDEQQAAHLVLNLALGWDGRFSGSELLVGNADANEPSTAPVKAVFSALRYASCLGVLVIAASGNTSGGPEDETGPLYPAAWEQVPAPTRDECQRMVGDRQLPDVFPGPDETDFYRPLVYAAGGVTTFGTPLSNTRDRSMPPRAAYADHAVVQAVGASQPTATLTGSSVSALITSASAAAAWYYRPSLKPYELMQVLYESGHGLSFGADWCQESPAPGNCPLGLRVQRISLCDAVGKTCGGGEDFCPTEPFACVAWTPDAADLSGIDLSGYDNPATVHQVDAQQIDQSWGPLTECDGGTTFYDDAVGQPTDPCPNVQYYGVSAEPWVNPQPGETPCPNCTLYTSVRRLYGNISSTWVGTLTNGVLRTNTTVYALGLPPLGAGAQIRVYNTPPGTYTSASVSFTNNLSSSATSSVLISR